MRNSISMLHAGPTAIVAADTDGDGHADLAVANQTSDEVIVLVNDDVVATLASAVTLDAGVHELSWEGSNVAGARVAPGVYHVQLSTPAATAGARLVIVR